MKPLVCLVVGVALVAIAAGPAFAQVPPVQIPPPTSPSGGGGASITQAPWAWQRTEYGDGTSVVASNPNDYTVTFRTDGRAVIQADCNTGSGGYTLDGQSLTFQPIAMSLVACPPGSQDTVFLRDLSQVATYVFDGDKLVLNLRLDTGNMIFSPLPPPTLTGVTWRVTGVNNGRGGVVSVVSGTQLTAIFGDDGRVNGDTGCNMFSGPYTIAGSSIAVGPLISTRRACLSEDANAQEQQFLTALAASSTYELMGARLTLRDADGATQVTLVRPVN
ncbi:MAG: META domain-containing protein [Chloroflexi bacterium]|nr:META domain-containing protein [Chloroflexota bacterium]